MTCLIEIWLYPVPHDRLFSTGSPLILEPVLSSQGGRSGRNFPIFLDTDVFAWERKGVWKTALFPRVHSRSNGFGCDGREMKVILLRTRWSEGPALIRRSTWFPMWDPQMCTWSAGTEQRGPSSSLLGNAVVPINRFREQILFCSIFYRTSGFLAGNSRGRLLGRILAFMVLWPWIQNFAQEYCYLQLEFILWHKISDNNASGHTKIFRLIRLSLGESKSASVWQGKVHKYYTNVNGIP